MPGSTTPAMGAARPLSVANFKLIIWRYKMTPDPRGKICVFTGSNPGVRAEYLHAARELGRVLVERNYGLVYGGTSVGLMAAIADTVLENGGCVIGVIPESLVDKEIAHPGLSDLHVVRSMHERKARMTELSDGFIALPGGLGTLDELFEVITWAQLGLHRKPCGLLNVCGYYDPLIRFLDHAVAERFLKPSHRATLMLETDARILLDRFESCITPRLNEWFDRDET